MRTPVTVCRVATLVCVAAVALALFGCGSGGHGGDTPSAETAVRAYAASDACHVHTDATTCAAASGCTWRTLAACPAGSTCPAGVCGEADACADHDDRASCDAAGCEWAVLGTALAACAAGRECNGGVCYARPSAGDACLCACPAYCPAGDACPPCACDCAPAGGGTCTCGCPPCPAGATCPPCDCNCNGDDGDHGSGDACGNTCVCDCPACIVGESCPPCDCRCDGGVPPPAPAPPRPPTRTCACPPCVPGDTCAPCDCGATDPCITHTDAAGCLADVANTCIWLALGRPCVEGVPCISGVCQHGPTSNGDGGCVCACPACPADESCPPCGCDCTGGGGGCTPNPCPGGPGAACTPNPATTPGPPPRPQ